MLSSRLVKQKINWVRSVHTAKPIHINDSKQSDRKHLVYHVTIHQFAQAFLPSMREQLYGGKTSWHSVSTINAKRLKMAF